MADEIGRETTRPEVPRVDESLFGDVADDVSAAAIDQEDSTGKTAQESRGSDDAQDEASTRAELKVVLSIKDSRATIGVQRPSSDPYIESFDDDDASGLALKVPAVIERARAQWEEAPKHPAYEWPAPPARRQRGRQQGTAQREPAGANETEAQQQTLSLF